MKNFYENYDNYKRRNKKHHSYWNWENIWRIVLIPIIIFALATAECIYGIHKYRQYCIEQAQIRAELEAEEKAKQEEKAKLEDIRRKVEEAKIRQANAEKELRTNTQNANLENDSKIAKKNCPKGTYVKNKDTGEFGQVTSNLGLQIYTNFGWGFLLKDNVGGEEYGTFPDNIAQLSYKEYKELLLKAQETKKYDKSKDEELKKAFNDELKRMEEELHKKFPMDQKFGYLEIDGKPYRFKDIDGGIIVLENGKRINGYAENIHALGYKEYEDLRVYWKYKSTK